MVNEGTRILAPQAKEVSFPSKKNIRFVQPASSLRVIFSLFSACLFWGRRFWVFCKRQDKGVSFCFSAQTCRGWNHMHKNQLAYFTKSRPRSWLGWTIRNPHLVILSNSLRRHVSGETFGAGQSMIYVPVARTFPSTSFSRKRLPMLLNPSPNYRVFRHRYLPPSASWKCEDRKCTRPPILPIGERNEYRCRCTEYEQRNRNGHRDGVPPPAVGEA